MSNATWMTDNASVLGGLPFNQIILPGTHDSGTFAITSSSPIAANADAAPIITQLNQIIQAVPVLSPLIGAIGGAIFDGIVAGWAKAQDQSIGTQLQNGIRYLDLRVYSNSGTLYLVHTMYQTLVSDAIGDLAQFVKQSPKEIVVVNLQHLYAMSDTDHQNLIQSLIAKLGSAIIPNTTPLTTSLNALWSAGQTVMLVYGDDYITQHPQSQLWSASALNIPWPSAAQNAAQVQSTLQGALPADFSPTQLFGLLGTITPDNDVIIAGLESNLPLTPRAPRNLQELAATVNAPILQWVTSLPASTPFNFVILDWFDEVPLVATVIEMNLRRVTAPTSNWIMNTDWNGAYGPPGGSVGQAETYADTNPVNVPAGTAATGFQFYFAGNRMYPNLQAGPFGQAGTWLSPVAFDPANPNYVPRNGCSGFGDTGSCTLYIDTTPLYAPLGKVVIGVQLRMKIGNRIAPQIVCATPSLGYSDAQVVLNDDNNGDFFVGGSNLYDFYIDAAPLSCPTGNVIIGFQLRQWQNRISFQLLTVPASDLP
jgi:hypothetical protein